MSKGFASNYRVVLLAAVVLLCFGTIGARLVSLQVINREKYTSKVGKARNQLAIEQARRGDIVDARDDRLATSRSFVQIAVDPNLYARFFRRLPQTTKFVPIGSKDPAHPPADPKDVKLNPANYKRILLTPAEVETIRTKELAKWRQLAQTLKIPEDKLTTACTTRKRIIPPDKPAATAMTATANNGGNDNIGNDDDNDADEDFYVPPPDDAPPAALAAASAPAATATTPATFATAAPRPAAAPKPGDTKTKPKKAQPDEDDKLTLADNEILDQFEWLYHAGVTEDVYKEIAALGIKSGLVTHRVYRRAYPHNQLAAQLIGYVKKDGAPASGIEAYANSFLFAADGWRETEKDGLQRELAQFRSRQVDTSNGYTVKLSIDSVIQNWAEEELASLARKYQPKHATIIISDAQTGFLLALANYPTFDLNAYTKAPVDVMRNYAITDQIDPGSTFKIVAASAALEEKLVTPDTRFDCTSDTIEYKGKKLTPMTDDGHIWTHPLSVAEIIAHSSNRGAVQLAICLGEQRLYDYALKFGFAARTGFPFGGEINGLLKTPDKWSGTDFTRIPAGYSVSATPLQIHYAMAVIASGGELLAPQIITEVRDTDGKTLFTYARQVRRRVISPETAATMRRLLQGTVSPGGTAAAIYTPGYQFAGKTGTAQISINGQYSKTNHVGSFVGFFPASNPRVVISVIVDDAVMPPKENGETTIAFGAKVAVPSFKKIADNLIPYLDIKPIPEPGAAPLFPQRAIVAARNP